MVCDEPRMTNRHDTHTTIDHPWRSATLIVAALAAALGACTDDNSDDGAGLELPEAIVFETVPTGNDCTATSIWIPETIDIPDEVGDDLVRNVLSATPEPPPGRRWMHIAGRLEFADPDDPENCEYAVLPAGSYGARTPLEVLGTMGARDVRSYEYTPDTPAPIDLWWLVPDDSEQVWIEMGRPSEEGNVTVVDVPAVP